MTLFLKLEKEVGLQEALESGQGKLEHDTMSCGDCWVKGGIVYCEQSKYYPNHPYHCCPLLQNCYCLAPEYRSDLLCYPDQNVP